MGFSKASLRAGGLLLGTICLLGCGPDPRARFITGVEAMIQKANEGRHGELEKCLSGPLEEKIKAEGWEPRAALVMVARKDREQAARYEFRDAPRFKNREYAEAEVVRTSVEGEKRFTVPFLWEDGKWKAAAAYRDGRSWDQEF